MIHVNRGLLAVGDTKENLSLHIGVMDTFVACTLLYLDSETIMRRRLYRCCGV